MTGEKVDFKEAQDQDDPEDQDSKYERSTIEFPYGDLNDAVQVATTIHSRYGLECEPDQLAAELKQSSKSGAFRLKTAASRTFGITDNERGKLRLTDLGRNVVNAQTMRRAKADAFLAVPLYKAIYDQFRGNVLPPAPALERIMQQLGVSSKQTSRARQAFERSAEQAGYFEAGKDRLVRPGNLGEMEEKKPLDERENKGSGGDGGGTRDLHPFIRGLLETLPAPKEQWSAENRAEWLQAAAQVFKLIYKGDSDGTVTVTFKKSGTDGGSGSN